MSREEMSGGPSTDDGPDEYFEKSLLFALRNYREEVDRISSVRFQEVTAEFFFSEYVWVVHATGFNAAVVGRMMPRLSEAYGTSVGVAGWAALGAEDPASVLERVRKVCNNPQKISAVRSTAGAMLAAMPAGSREEWESFRESRLSSPDLLSALPYVGRITCFHLARNIGLLEHVKPDLHLVRLASHWGFRDCLSMCESVRDSHEARTGERMPLGIVDLVLWYACSTFGTLSARTAGGR